MANNDDLLKEIHERFDYAMTQWRRIRKEGQEDMKYLSGDPWDPEERKARIEARRPCISLDELNQYVNQLVNEVRQNPRAIKVVPKGSGANDKTAEFRGELIRGIEYRSNAQTAYSTAFQDATSRGYGSFRIGKRYISERDFDQELVIRRIPNPDTVLFDPDARELDCSDGLYAFVLDAFGHEEFKRRWPKAETRNFSGEEIKASEGWINDHSVQVAEYWRVERRPRKLVLFQGPAGPVVAWADETPEGAEILNERESEERKIVQYITNGLEILERNDWDGKYIPIVPVFGKELWLDDGAGARRVLMSLVRLARDPYMLYCYYRTCQMEIVGQVPKVPWVGYEGQFEGHEDEWASANRVPIAYLQAKPVLDGTGQSVLPLPQRQVWEPPIQALEIGAESARRAIQAAMGITALPTAAQRKSEKSGIALQRIEEAEAQGSYHFIDSYERALEHAGRILNDLIDKTYDTEREVGLRKPDDTHAVVRINTPQPVRVPGSLEPVQFRTDEGEHDVTISTGPSFKSQREEASQFADTLVGIPEIFAKIADLVIKLKNLGPVGDEIAKRLAPPEAEAGKMSPAQVQALIQQHQALTAQVNALTQELETKRPELESRERIAAMQGQVQLVLAEIKAQSAEGIELLRAQLGAIEQRLALLHQDKPISAGGEGGNPPAS